MRRIKIPAGAEYDEGKKGPWLKLTWAQAETLADYLEGDGDMKYKAEEGDNRAKHLMDVRSELEIALSFCRAGFTDERQYNE